MWIFLLLALCCITVEKLYSADFIDHWELAVKRECVNLWYILLLLLSVLTAVSTITTITTATVITAVTAFATFSTVTDLWLLFSGVTLIMYPVLHAWSVLAFIRQRSSSYKPFLVILNVWLVLYMYRVTTYCSYF